MNFLQNLKKRALLPRFCFEKRLDVSSTFIDSCSAGQRVSHAIDALPMGGGIIGQRGGVAELLSSLNNAPQICSANTRMAKARVAVARKLATVLHRMWIRSDQIPVRPGTRAAGADRGDTS